MPGNQICGSKMFSSGHCSWKSRKKKEKINCQKIKYLVGTNLYNFVNISLAHTVNCPKQWHNKARLGSKQNQLKQNKLDARQQQDFYKNFKLLFN